MAKLRVKVIAERILIVERTLNASGSSRKTGIFLPARRLQPLGKPGTHNSPPRVYTRPLGNSGIVQIIPQGAPLPRPCAAQRGLDIILDSCGFGVDALPQRIEGAGQRAGCMDGTGAPLKKAAVSGFGVGLDSEFPSFR